MTGQPPPPELMKGRDKAFRAKLFANAAEDLRAREARIAAELRKGAARRIAGATPSAVPLDEPPRRSVAIHQDCDHGKCTARGQATC